MNKAENTWSFVEEYQFSKLDESYCLVPIEQQGDWYRFRVHNAIKHSRAANIVDSSNFGIWGEQLE